MDAEIDFLEEQFDDFDDSEIIARMRESRIKQLKDRVGALKEQKTKKYGCLTVASEKEVLEYTTKEKHVVVHFYSHNFKRCKIMNSHLESLAKDCYDTKFLKVEAEKAPFLVEKLKIKVLPCVISFKNAIAFDYLIGFEELGNKDDFTYQDLKRRLFPSK